jgi:hypothetical protein
MTEAIEPTRNRHNQEHSRRELRDENPECELDDECPAPGEDDSVGADTESMDKRRIQRSCEEATTSTTSGLVDSSTLCWR